MCNLAIVLLGALIMGGVATPDVTEGSLAEIGARLSRETAEAYEASPFAQLSKDYFARFTRDADAKPRAGEVAIDNTWQVVVAPDEDPLASLMGGYFVDFLSRCMGVDVETTAAATGRKRIVLTGAGGGTTDVAESFTISIAADEVRVAGRDARGLRDGVVKLADLMGFREAPFLEPGEQVYTPRLPVRLGAVPRSGSYRELVFLGYNAAFTGGGSLYALSTSNAIPELDVRKQPGALAGNVKAAAEARKHGLKTFAFVDTRRKFPEDDPVFKAHPDIRGSRTWKADGEFNLCTEHPLVRQFLTEAVEGIFKNDPGLNGMVLIIGGEGFYHCYMRPFGVEKGHTNCARCEPLGAETVVANLCNRLAAAARSVRPDAEIIVWPYSAAHAWSADATQEKLIEKLEPGVAILTEIEKDEYIQKPQGVNKHLWDYSIDLIGPGERARKQIAAARAAGISIYLKSEPELGFEAPRLPHIPCLDRWVDRAEALASCGATGAFVFPAFRSCYGTSAAEVAKYVWWDPAPDHDELLQRFAARLFGAQAAAPMRRAWKQVSAAIEFSPELPPYYTGPYYLGPAHPMCADPDAELPEVFFGHYLFYAELSDAEGLKTRPTFLTSPRGDVPVFLNYYRQMEALLAQAVKETTEAEPLVPDRKRLMFDAEASPIRWFYHTARAQANFYEPCQLRDKLFAFASERATTGSMPAEAGQLLQRWRDVLLDEQANAREALPVAEKDMRLDWYYGGDHTFPHAVDMLRAKLTLIEHELDTFLPAFAAKNGLAR